MLNPVSRPSIKHRLFFALVPPPLVARRVAHWADHRFGPHAACVRADRLHVTLDILEDVAAFPRETVERLVEAAATVASDPFVIELDQVNGGGGVVALRPRLKNAALHDLAARIADARENAGIAPRNGYRFSPHVTLVYRESSPFNEVVTPFAWEVKEFVLVHSLLGRAHHIPLGSWPLCGTDPDQFDLF